MTTVNKPKRDKTLRITIYTAVALLAVMMLLARYRAEAKPSRDQIVLDCERLVDATTVWEGRGLLPVEKVPHPFKSVSGTRILGVSVSGNEAIVEVDVPLEGRMGFQILAEGGGEGFGNYFKTAEQVAPYKELRIRAKLLYRKYDSGWRLESY